MLISIKLTIRLNLTVLNLYPYFFRPISQLRERGMPGHAHRQAAAFSLLSPIRAAKTIHRMHCGPISA